MELIASKKDLLAAMIGQADPKAPTDPIERAIGEFNENVVLAVEIRAELIRMGIMATKSRVEDAMMMTSSAVDRTYAHGIMNHIEYHNVDLNIWSHIGPASDAIKRAIGEARSIHGW